MTEQLRAYLNEQMQAVDEDVREAIELADGDVTRALRITLIANAFLQEENERLKARLETQVSKGFRRAR